MSQNGNKPIKAEQADRETELEQLRKEELSPHQEKAIELKLDGEPHSEIAQHSQVDRSRQTVSNWFNNNQHVKRAYRLRLEQKWGQAIDDSVGAVPKAIENIREEIASGDIDASFELLKAIGLYGEIHGVHKERQDAEVVKDEFSQRLLRTINRVDDKAHVIQSLNTIVKELSEDELSSLALALHDEERKEKLFGQIDGRSE